jgi:hypothetical protein
VELLHSWLHRRERRPCGRLPQGPVHEFDVVGHPGAEFHYCIVFPYHSADGSLTLVREYAQVGLTADTEQRPTGSTVASSKVCCLAEGRDRPRRG